MYPIIELIDITQDSPEYLGTKPKFWFKNDDSIDYLFKEGRADTGENWAEKIACEICATLAIPHAHYELAIYGDKKGVITPNFVATDCRLIHGNEILVRRIKKYPMTKFYGVREHSLNFVLRIMGLPIVNPPIGWDDQTKLKKAADIFVGYLMLDALIANQDRHHENWGLILTHENKFHLAPTFDHASSLGRNESDERRKKILEECGRDKRRIIESYVERASAAFYSSKPKTKRIKTVEAFIQAGRARPRAAVFWLEKLQELSNEEIRNIIIQIPKSEISELAIQFSMEMLKLNRERLLATGEKI
jgi:hypothetical protein